MRRDRQPDFRRRRLAGIVRGRTFVGGRAWSFGLRRDECAAILSELTDEPLFKRGIGAGGWRPIVRIAVTYDDGGVTTYLIDPRCRLWHCDDPHGGGEQGDRLATVGLGPIVTALIDKHRRHSNESPPDTPDPDASKSEGWRELRRRGVRRSKGDRFR